MVEKKYAHALLHTAKVGYMVYRIIQGSLVREGLTKPSRKKGKTC